MHPVSFPQVNAKLAKGQPQYTPLPCFIIETNEKHIFKYTFKLLSDIEIQQLIKTKYTLLKSAVPFIQC